MIDAKGMADQAVMLVGSDAALLEGLSQSLAALGYFPRVVSSLHDARESSLQAPPLVLVIDRELAALSTADALAIAIAPGGALVLYSKTDDRLAIAPALQRAVRADLTLPLERNRLIALAVRVQERARATGRPHRTTPPEQRMS
jgi:DNA-binding NtrC family response regulator